jgi:Prophage antirepressor
MENNQTFHFQGKKIQIKVIESEPWFLAADICNVLGNSDVSNMVKNANVKYSHVRRFLNRTNDVHREMLFVDESGMYKILIKSKKAIAEKFQDWVSEQVLPSIKNTGRYNVIKDNTLQTDCEEKLIKVYADLIEAKAALIQAKRNFYNDIVNSAITFEQKGDLKLAAIIRAKIGNSVLIETKNTEVNTSVINSVDLNLPESALDVSLRLGYNIPPNYESALGKAVKSKCEDLLMSKYPEYSKTDYVKTKPNIYPPKNKRVEDAVIAYCKDKNFSVQPSLSIVK